jgi:hypothetical protein
MSKYFEVKGEPSFLHVDSFQSVADSTIRKFFSDVPNLARKAGFSKVLVDARTAGGDVQYAAP